MVLFALIFLSVYALMHGIVWLVLRPLCPCHGRYDFLGLIVPVLAPLAVRLLEHSGHARLATILAWPTYIWFGLVFMAFCLSLPVVLWKGVQRLTVIPFLQPGRRIAQLVLVVTVTCGGLAMVGANELRIETVRLQTDKALPGGAALRAVQVSDWHLGLLTRHADVERTLKVVRDLQPDLLLITGDLVDARSLLWNEYADMLRSLQPRYGKYLVTGNHEAYVGLAAVERFARRAGLVLLRNRMVMVAGCVTLLGVDDPAAGGRDTDEIQLRSNADAQAYRILLKHRPQPLAEEEQAAVDLQLSGHAHRGQIFPFGLVTGLRYPFQDGLSRHEDGMWLYASRGTGFWGPPMRLGSPPEVTLLEIIPSGLEARGGDRLLSVNEVTPELREDVICQ